MLQYPITSSLTQTTTQGPELNDSSHRGERHPKAILNPLVPELTYKDLVIVDGRVASVEIARLLFLWPTRSLRNSGTRFGRICWSIARGILGPR